MYSMQLGSQVKFINTIKYYNQSISSLAKSVDENDSKWWLLVKWKTSYFLWKNKISQRP